MTSIFEFCLIFLLDTVVVDRMMFALFPRLKTGDANMDLRTKGSQWERGITQSLSMRNIPARLQLEEN